LARLGRRTDDVLVIAIRNGDHFDVDLAVPRRFGEGGGDVGVGGFVLVVASCHQHDLELGDRRDDAVPVGPIELSGGPELGPCSHRRRSEGRFGQTWKR
jgi:hypothetical protein